MMSHVGKNEEVDANNHELHESTDILANDIEVGVVDLESFRSTEPSVLWCLYNLRYVVWNYFGIQGIEKGCQDYLEVFRQLTIDKQVVSDELHKLYCISKDNGQTDKNKCSTAI